MKMGSDGLLSLMSFLSQGSRNSKTIPSTTSDSRPSAGNAAVTWATFLQTDPRTRQEEDTALTLPAYPLNRVKQPFDIIYSVNDD